MNRTTVCLAAVVVCWSLVFASPAFADPTGVVYGAGYFGDIIDLVTGAQDREDHIGITEFDGLPDLLKSFPNPAPPFLPGNDAVFTEELVENPDGTETISMWFEAETPGLSLFVNTLDLDGLVIFGFGSLDWNDPSTEARVTDIEVEVSFPNKVVVEPLSIDVFGRGIPFDWLEIQVSLDPADLFFPAGDINGIPATDFHLSFTVTHVPEPSSFLLTTLALLGLLVRGRWFRSQRPIHDSVSRA